MKNVVTILILLIGTLSFGQTESLTGKATFSNSDGKLENLSIEVTVDSAAEVKSTFTTQTIKELIGESENGEEFSFKITCNGLVKPNGVRSKVSYEVKGTTEDKRNFLKSVKKIRAAAINYYESKQ